MKTEDFDAAIPDEAFVDDGGMERKILVADNIYALLPQSGCIIIFFLCVNHYFYSI